MALSENPMADFSFLDLFYFIIKKIFFKCKEGKITWQNLFLELKNFIYDDDNFFKKKLNLLNGLV